MKHTLIPVILSCAALLAAKDIPVRMDKAKIGDSKIPGWSLNTFGFKDGVGKGEIVAGSQDGIKAFKFTTTNRMTSFYVSKAEPVKIGDVLEITARVKGKGRLILGYYAYAEKHRYLQAAKDSSREITLTDEWQEVKCVITVSAPPKGDLKMIRPMITLRPNSDMLMEDIVIELTYSGK